MFTTGVQPGDWAGYFDRLMTELPTTWATVTIDAPHIGHQVEASDLILESLSYDRRDDVFEVAAFLPGPNGRAVVRHMISGPARIDVDSRAGILPTSIEIENREGITTLVRLHAAPSLSG